MECEPKERVPIQNVIVSDIFGRTEALDALAAHFTTPTEIHDPYQAKFMGFSNEDNAYDYFSRHITLERYSENLFKRLQSITSPINLIGFSVGASAIWKISNQPELKNVISAYGYYGSQIRNFLHIKPIFPVHLTFPISELHFSVQDVMNTLSNINKVSLRKVPYSHGFMNFHSLNYNHQGCKDEISTLCEMPFNN